MGIVTCDISVTLDGLSATADQSLERPFGALDDTILHGWYFDHPDDHPEFGGGLAAGAFVMGRNMFGPGRGPWDLGWTGWWGPEPPFRAPVFVLTHHPREPAEMAGGTTFHFVTEGPEAALRRARETAGERDVAVSGGATTINQYLAAGAVDELRLHVVPYVADAPGVRLFDGVGPGAWTAVSGRWTPEVSHLVYRR
ncbi:dihydrofolate reductase family protein [Puerhibacterium sp. TATVAM-FAB25]|uniref:dihydrofolate reductase family protein n=1 Tax=Puerhibacterium sp. TATVAM-FAB25 TaxID=3093699 RepID=UPI00397B5D06